MVPSFGAVVTGLFSFGFFIGHCCRQDGMENSFPSNLCCAVEHIHSPPFRHRPQRLAEKFEFGGGKALPEEMTGPVMPIPSEARWKASEERRVAQVMRRRKGLPEDNEDSGGGGGGGGGEKPAKTMFDQVMI